MDIPSSPTLVRQDKVPFLAYPSSHKDEPNRRQCLLFFIPGNPGLIAYYAPFFRTLRHLLDEMEGQEGCPYAFHIHGRNLLGFEDADHSPAFGTPLAGTKTEPFSLEDQILASCAHLQTITTSTFPSNRPFDEVILIGHSVGAYISLEIFNRHHHHSTAASSALASVPLKSGILLFPTISHIARSSSGQKLDLIRRTPLLDRSVHHLAKGLVDLFPRWVLGAVVRRVMRFPEHATAATIQFVTSRDGIWQALHMGKDEMRTITEERWEEEMWEIQDAEEEEEEGREWEVEEKGQEGERTKFFFYFAEKDHWVADECRDEFIEKRRRHEKGRTKVVIDEAGIPHAFCIHHSEMVAEKVKVWIEDIVGL
ncbi:hypothetical protein VTI74DRAFT_4560 [Chaetomium olivicolor]